MNKVLNRCVGVCLTLKDEVAAKSANVQFDPTLITISGARQPPQDIQAD